MADVLELPAGAPSGTPGQVGVFAGASGDPGLLIHRDHHRVVGAAPVQVAHVGGAGEELRVGRAGQPAAHQVGLEIDGVQDPSDLGGRDGQPGQVRLLGQQPVGPHRVRARRRRGGRGDDPQPVFGAQPRPSQRPGAIDQGGRAFDGEPFAPGPDGVQMPTRLAADLGVGRSGGQSQDHRGPLHLPERRGSGHRRILQLLPFFPGQLDHERTGQSHRPTLRSAY